MKIHLESDNGCDFVMVECPNKYEELYMCSSRMIESRISLIRRGNLSIHLAQSCYLQPYRCVFCGLKDTYEAITGQGCRRCR